jgi:hypothetical protein
MNKKDVKAEKKVSFALIVGVIILTLLIVVNAEENITNVTENITLNDSNFTLNITLNETNTTLENSTNFTLENTTLTNTTLENITNITLGNSTDTNISNSTNITTNLSLINQTLTDIINNVTNHNATVANNSLCWSTYDDMEYNISVNGTAVTKNATLVINLCYNESTVTCYSNSDSPSRLFRVNTSNLSCGNNNCRGAESLSNPYDISGQVFDEATVFVCFGKLAINGYSMWAYQAINLYDQDNVFYFDFTNSSFIMNDYNVTNETVYNITNNITHDIVNNITNNFTYVENISNDILNNITANLTGLETRVTVLEVWRAEVDETLKYLINIVDTISKLLEKNIFFYDFSNSNFVENNYSITNQTTNNITNNVTNNITNNEIYNYTHVYNITNNITNNITAENITNLETRVTNLEIWKDQVTETLDYIVNLVNQIVEKINQRLGIKI